jgi:hypothetical protein
MKKFLGIYLDADAKTFNAAWRSQEQHIISAMRDDALGAKRVPPGELHKIDNTEVRQSFEPDIDLAVRAHAMLKLFHNMRAALHVPDQPPEKAPPFQGKRADLQFEMVKRQTDLTEKIRPPYDAGTCLRRSSNVRCASVAARVCSMKTRWATQMEALTSSTRAQAATRIRVTIMEQDSPRSRSAT